MHHLDYLGWPMMAVCSLAISAISAVLTIRWFRKNRPRLDHDGGSGIHSVV